MHSGHWALRVQLTLGAFTAITFLGGLLTV